MTAAGGAFDLGEWRDFGVALASAAAALTGLVFVAVSLRLALLSRNQGLRLRATFSLFALFSVLVGAVAVVIPQSPRALGAELLGLTIFGPILGVLVATGDSSYWRRGSTDLGRLQTVLGLPNWAVGLAGGTSLVLERGYGMYLVAPSMIISLGMALAAAWAVLLAAAEEAASQDGEVGPLMG